jgi:hypothetical protein
MSLVNRLVKKVNSTNMGIQQELDQGASYNTLSSAIYRSRLLMKMHGDVESWDEEASEKDLPEKWPLELDDWWIGEKKEAFIYWDDIKSTEAEYISELAELLAPYKNYKNGNFCKGPVTKVYYRPGRLYFIAGLIFAELATIAANDRVSSVRRQAC